MTRRLVILFHPRCGSTWLMSILSANKNVFARYEILEKKSAFREKLTAEGHCPFVDYREQLQVIDKFITKANESGQILHAFKMAPYQMLSLPNIMQHLNENNFSVVKLYRENIVQATVSQLGAKKLRMKTGQANAGHTRPGHNIESLRQIRVERKEFFAALGLLLRERDRQNVAAAYVPESEMLTVTYEMMLNDLSNVIGMVGELSGVPIEAATPKTRKNLNNRLSESVENYDEMRSWLVGTYLEDFLDE